MFADDSNFLYKEGLKFFFFQYINGLFKCDVYVHYGYGRQRKNVLICCIPRLVLVKRTACIDETRKTVFQLITPATPFIKLCSITVILSILGKGLFLFPPQVDLGKARGGQGTVGID